MKEYVCGFPLFYNVGQASFDYVICPERAVRRTLLIEKNRPEKQAGKFNGVGGKIEDGETALAAMVRECKEETGLSINEWKQFAIMEGADFRVYFFKAFIDTIPEWKSPTDEVVCCFRTDELPKNLVPAVGFLVPLALEENVSEVTVRV